MFFILSLGRTDWKATHKGYILSFSEDILTTAKGLGGWGRKEGEALSEGSLSEG